MKKDTIKSHLLIDNKFLGALLYFKDIKGIGCLKLSFKNKIANLVKWSDMPTIKPVPLEVESPTGIDISYKFGDNKLEVKKIINGKIEREFYEVSIPISNPLFILKIKNWQSLDNSKNPDNPLILNPTKQSDSVAVVFSFLGVEGKPIAPKDYPPMEMGVIDLPETNFNKFCIGITDYNNNGDKDFAIEIPLINKP